MSKMKLSVVTPSYNQAEFIERCIQSVLDQQYENFEHIIVDNCSDDGTAEVLIKYPHLKVICEQDEGQCDAINKGVAAASGEWFLWLNADDVLLPGAFSSFADAISKHPEATVVYSHIQFIDERDQLIKKRYNIKYRYFLTKYGASMPPSTGTMFKTRFFSENPLDINYHYVMDSEWFLRCGHRIRMILVDRINSSFRVSDNNKTSCYAKTGTVVPRHSEEREMYKKLHVFPIIGQPSMDRAIYKIFHATAVIFLKVSKLKYIMRYVSDKREARRC